ncbi:MAG TPA: hypothetical protein VFC63_28045 [Blastocatellia bacterium]|nr:hypothetical protein [Blastocatellia bacterium]
MPTVELSVNASSLEEMDRLAKELEISRDDFIHLAFSFALRNQKTMVKERQHELGYARHPMDPEEIDLYDRERIWS